jgi:DNA-binding MarR family transcriptional regulator
MIADCVAPAGLTPLQFAVMSYLNKRNGEPGIDQSGLAARLGVDRNNASLLVEQLVQMGLLCRRVSEDDRRARLLHLTSKGERLHLQFQAANVEANNRILNPLTPAEQKLLLDMLTRVVMHNAAFARPGAGRRKPKRARSPSD